MTTLMYLPVNPTDHSQPVVGSCLGCKMTVCVSLIVTMVVELMGLNASAGTFAMVVFSKSVKFCWLMQDWSPSSMGSQVVVTNKGSNMNIHNIVVSMDTLSCSD